MLTQEQLERRRSGIGSSDIAAIIGKSPFASPMSVYVSKVDHVDVAATEPMRAGQFFESSIARWYAARERVRLSAVPPTLSHPKHEWMIGNIDRFAVRGRGRTPYRVVEIKLVLSAAARQEWGEEGTDAAPFHYLAQVAWQLEIAHARHGVDQAHVVASFAGREPHVYPVQRDPELGEILIAAGARFWQDHVLARKPPPMDDSDDAQEWLKKMYPRGDGRVVPASADSLKWFRQYGAARDAEREAVALKKQAAAFLKYEIADRQAIKGPLGIATWRTENGHVDWENYARELGGTDEGAAKHTTTIRKLNVTLND